jgi:hypothetical protein
MGFLKKLSNLFTAPPRAQENVYPVTVKCKRCGEVIRARINLFNDLSSDITEDGQPVYYCRKMLIGESGQCFQRVEVILKFDAKRKLLDREIIGGEFMVEPA